MKKVKVLTEKQLKVADAQKLKARIRELKETALSPPKRLAVTALQVIVSEGSLPVPQRTQEAVRKYKALTPEELEVIGLPT